MKLKDTLSIIGIIFLILLSSIPSNSVNAQSRDGGDPVNAIGICAFIGEDSSNLSRDGVSVWAGHWIDFNDNVAPFTEVLITLSGYDNPAYWDFGLPAIPGKENTYSLSPGFLYGWTRSPYPLGSEPQELSVTIDGVTKSLYIPTAIEAFQLIEEGGILPCPDPWPETPRLHYTFLPIVLNGQN